MSEVWKNQSCQSPCDIWLMWIEYLTLGQLKEVCSRGLSCSLSTSSCALGNAVADVYCLKNVCACWGHADIDSMWSL